MAVFKILKATMRNRNVCICFLVYEFTLYEISRHNFLPTYMKRVAISKKKMSSLIDCSNALLQYSKSIVKSISSGERLITLLFTSMVTSMFARIFCAQLRKQGIRVIKAKNDLSLLFLALLSCPTLTTGHSQPQSTKLHCKKLP